MGEKAVDLRPRVLLFVCVCDGILNLIETSSIDVCHACLVFSVMHCGSVILFFLFCWVSTVLAILALGSRRSWRDLRFSKLLPREVCETHGL